MTDLTTDMSTASIPYLEFDKYAMKLLFPSFGTHPVMEIDVCFLSLVLIFYSTHTRED